MPAAVTPRERQTACRDRVQIKVVIFLITDRPSDAYEMDTQFKRLIFFR